METQHLKKYLPALLVFGLGLTLSFGIFLYVKHWELKSIRAAFNARAKVQANTVSHVLNTYMNALYALGAYYAYSDYVSREEFTHFTNSLLERYPGIKAMSWNPLVPHQKRNQMVRKAQEQGTPDFSFTQKNSKGKLVPAGKRNEYVVVYYITPMAANRQALGFDIASSPTRLAAINQAFDTGSPVATARIKLVQETGHKYGVLVLLPIFKNHDSGDVPAFQKESRRGFVVEVLRIGDIIRTVQEKFTSDHMDITLLDITDTGKNQLLYKKNMNVHFPNDDLQNKTTIQQEMAWEKSIPFAGRNWQILIHPASQTGMIVKDARISFLAALGLTCLIFFYMIKKVMYTTRLEQEILNKNEARENLKKSEQLFKAFFNQSYQFSLLLDTKGKVLEMNSLCTEICGDLADATIGKKLWEAGWWKDFPEVVDQTKTAITTLDKKGVAMDEVRFLDKTGQIRFGIRTFAGIRDETGKALYISVAGLDITNRKKMEEENLELGAQLHQARKMEAIGTLAGGIAHDFNNILSIILGNAELLKLEQPAEQPLEQPPEQPKDSYCLESLSEIEIACMRAKEMVSQLLRFSRESEEEKHPLDLLPVMKEAVKLLRSSTPANIRFKTDLPETLWLINGNPIQIHQILINLFTNATHAMQENKGGTITLSAGNRLLASSDKPKDPVEAPADTPTGIPEGRYLTIRVTDTGHGIPDSIRDKIFDPYFTTKEQGKGSGMGLAVVHGIVNHHSGFIWVKSRPGEGSQFHIYFPAIDAQKIATPEKKQMKLPKGSASLLFIDDEESITAIVQKNLKTLGYEVASFNDPKKALHHLAQHPSAFDLIVTDMSMPQLTGDECIARARQICPTLPAIICTGFSEQMNLEKALELGISGFVMKPFQTRELGLEIQRVLGDTETASGTASGPDT